MVVTEVRGCWLGLEGEAKEQKTKVLAYKARQKPGAVSIEGEVIKTKRLCT